MSDQNDRENAPDEGAGRQDAAAETPDEAVQDARPEAETPSDADLTDAGGPAVAETVAAEPAAEETAAGEPTASETVVEEVVVEETVVETPHRSVTDVYASAPPAADTIVAAEPEPGAAPAAVAEPAAAAPAAPVYVEAPREPKKAGNRGVAILIGLVATLVFAGVTLAVDVLQIVLDGSRVEVLDIVLSPAFAVPVGMFLIGWIIVAALVNRAGWWAWILGGLLIGAFAYVGAIGGELIRDAMTVPSNRVVEYLTGHLLSWHTVAAFVVGRELSVWFGAWAGGRGRRVAARNAARREEYEQSLEAGTAA